MAAGPGSEYGGGDELILEIVQLRKIADSALGGRDPSTYSTTAFPLGIAPMTFPFGEK